jgi:hypothetical protein
MKDLPLSPAERELQEALAKLAPSSAGISRDETIFEAGRASVPQVSARFWKIAASSMLVITIGAICFRSERIVDRPVERIVRVYDNKEEGRTETTKAAPMTLAHFEVEQKAPEVTLTNLPADSYFCLRAEMVKGGLKFSATKNEEKKEEVNDAPKPQETSQPLWRLRQKDMGGAF